MRLCARQSADNFIGKVEAVGFERGSRKTPHQQVMSKFDRRNRAKQIRINKDNEHAKATNVFAGRDSAA